MGGINKLIAEQLEIHPECVVPAARLVEDLGADSLNLIQLVMALEEEYRIEIPDQDWKKLLTVKDVYIYVEAKVGSS